MRISDWSSDVCSSDLIGSGARQGYAHAHFAGGRNLALDADDLLAAFEELGRIRPIGLDPEIADAILESVHMHARGGFAAARTERQRVGIGDADRQHRAQKHQAAEKHSSRSNFVHDLSTLAGYSATFERARAAQFHLRSEEHTSEIQSPMRDPYA